MANYAAETLQQIEATQQGFNAISLLQFTAYLYAQSAFNPRSKSYDYVILGGGTSGCVIANRLTEDPNVSVLLIEAGGDPPLESVYPGLDLYMKRSRVDWKYNTEYDRNNEKCRQIPYFEVVLGKMLGGTSSIDFQYYARGYRFDYVKWAAAAKDNSWLPNNLLPYFKKSERLQNNQIRMSDNGQYHGYDGLLGVTVPTGGPYGFLKGFEEVGNDIVLDMNGNNTVGYSKVQVTAANGTRQSTAYSFLSPVIKRKNLDVLKNTFVNKIIIKNKIATGAEIVTKCNEKIIINAKKEVIVTTGPINTPQILMLSGIGPKDHLESKGIEVIANLPVGKNLQDHIATVITFNVKKANTKMPFNPSNYTSPNTHGYVSLNKSQTQPDYESLSFYSQSYRYSINNCVFNFRLNFDICNYLYTISQGKDIIMSIISNLSPKSRGEVLLNTVNAQDPPKIIARYLSKKIDLENLAKYAQDFASVINSTYFKGVGGKVVNLASSYCDDFSLFSLDYWRCYANCLRVSRNRYCGTCALGTVVDARLRVKGIKRLRVADESIMPVIVSSDTRAATIMIGEKAADMIKEDNQ